MTSLFLRGQDKSLEITNLSTDFPELIKDDFNIISSDIITDSLNHKYISFSIIPKQKGALYNYPYVFRYRKC